AYRVLAALVFPTLAPGERCTAPAVTRLRLPAVALIGAGGGQTRPAARAPRPADANGVSRQYTQLVDISCPDVGNCVAVGGDRAGGPGGDVYHGLIETLSDGTWTATAVPDMSTKTGVAALGGVSCPALGTCVAVGLVDPAGAASTPV